MEETKEEKNEFYEELLKALEPFKLNIRERAFLLDYVDSHNATQSYLKCYSNKVSKKNARISACVLLKRPYIQEALKALRDRLEVEYNVSHSEYIETLVKVATADIGDYIKFSEEEIPLYDETGLPILDEDTGEQRKKKVNRMHLADSSTVDTSVVSEIKQGKDGITIRLIDKLKAWEQLAKYFCWGEKKDDSMSESTANKLIEALNKNATNSWKDVDNDLEELEKDFK